MRGNLDLIRASTTYGLLDHLPADDRDFHREPAELWARAYAQWVAWRSGSSLLKGQLDKVLTHDDDAIRIRQWPYDEFAPIAAAIDRLMVDQGWARRKTPPAP